MAKKEAREHEAEGMHRKEEAKKHESMGMRKAIKKEHEGKHKGMSKK